VRPALDALPLDPRLPRARAVLGHYLFPLKQIFSLSVLEFPFGEAPPDGRESQTISRSREFKNAEAQTWK
jgi:hypothetical protein